MELARDEQEEGSRKTCLLTCGNGALCEQSRGSGSCGVAVELSKGGKGPLTCVRALPGVGVSTGALARLKL